MMVCADKWPYVNEENKLVRIDNGWLLSGENEIQFHLFDSPLQLWNEEGSLKKHYAVLIKPMRKTSSGLVDLDDYVINSSVSIKV